MSDNAVPSSSELAALRAAAAQAAAEAAAAKAEAAQAALEAALAAAQAGPQATSPVPAPASATQATASGSELSGYAAEVAAGYAYQGGTLALGALLEAADGGEPQPNAAVQVGFALGMLNRHGLVAGATGTGKTKTLQGMAEGLSSAGVPVFLADIKGDLSGLAQAGADNPKVAERASGIGQQWKPTAFPTELYTLGGLGQGVPIRTTVTDFGPLLLAKVLGLNETQESCLGLIFHWADSQGLALLDLKDLKSTIAYLVSDDGKNELKGIGGLSAATAGVILREIVTFQAQGADVFFGEPAFDTANLLRVAADGRGMISCLELPAVQDRPALFSTFLMWLLADMYQDLPEVGDAEKPKLVFFFDEAHLLFNGATKQFLQSVVQTVRLIRSKGVGVFFITQSPKDVPSDVLAQLGNRVQHALRAFTPEDADALRQAVRTFPHSPYDLERLLQSLGTGEAIVTVLTEKGAPTPVAWTRVRAPESAMAPADPALLNAIIAASPLQARYGTPVDNESAYEILAQRVQRQALEAEAAKVAEQERITAEKAQKEAEREAAKRQAELDRMRARLERDAAKAEQERDRATTRSSRSTSSSSKRSSSSPLDNFLKSAGTQLGRELTRTIFGTRKR